MILSYHHPNSAFWWYDTRAARVLPVSRPLSCGCCWCVCVLVCGHAACSRLALQLYGMIDGHAKCLTATVGTKPFPTAVRTAVLTTDVSESLGAGRYWLVLEADVSARTSGTWLQRCPRTCALFASSSPTSSPPLPRGPQS